MPDPNERHARPGKYQLYPDSQPSRSQQKAAAASEPAVKRPPGRKDPDLCKGNHWKPHTPQVTLDTNGWRGKGQTCGWGVWGWRSPEPYWSCRHVLICTGCGKDFGRVSPSLCPLWHAVTPEEQAFLDEKLEQQEELRARWKVRKPVINGPQHYRKKR